GARSSWRFFRRSGLPPDPHSFPTRRSSDLLILLCSDGLTGMVDDAELAAILARDDLPLDGLARELTAAANRNGGMDNITAILIRDRKSTRLNSSHVKISYAVFCLKKKKKTP